MQHTKALIPTPAKWIIYSFFGSNLATFMVMPIMAVYLSTTLGYSGEQVAMVVSLYFCMGRLTPILVGALSDKFGSYSFIYCGLTLRALGFLAFPITDSFTTVCAAAVAIGLGGACFETPSYSLIQYVDSKIKDRCVVMLNMGLNLGVILGPLVGSLISMISLSIPFYLSGCLFLLLAMGIFVSPKFDAIKLNASSIKSIFKQPFHNTAFIFLLFIAFPWFTVFAQMFISLPMEMVRISGVDSWASAVFLINGIIGVAVLKIGSSVISKFPFYALPLCFIVAGISFAIILSGLGLAAYLVALVVFSVAEVAMLPALEIIIFRIAPAASNGSYFGVFNVVFGLGTALGSFMGGYTFNLGKNGLWLCMIAVTVGGFIIAMLFNILAVKRLHLIDAQVPLT